MHQIAEGVRLNCNSFNTNSMRKMIVIGLGIAVGHPADEIADFLGLSKTEVQQIAETMEKAVLKGYKETALAKTVRQDGESIVDTLSMMLYRKFRLVVNYLAIVSIFYNDPCPDQCGAENTRRPF